ncbi:MAG: small multi-drug export protein [Candidatus Jacksonbacteria bacterium]|nr:small multi-drug export protein [Candidatus Jacksonbacteria bacterium]MBT6034346.1 small multi-drug export protein [Candidatus Jacksonbacteria bacterium]MBT6301314.1 small multi-drug export protein [Candidatus Jacksonbacteria bacterium]MBT7008340.1 small multi-drug export protein [Candidatus Jacksonbacteria bacterium]
MLSHILYTFFLAMTPIGELRAAIPVAIAVYKLDPWLTLMIAAAGNLVPVFFIYIVLKEIEKRIKKSIESTFDLAQNNREEFIKTVLEKPEEIKKHLTNKFLLFAFVLYSFFLRRSYRRWAHDHQKMAFFSLALFVAIPLPVTGAWTGTALAYLFGIPLGRAFPSILLGIFASALIVTVISLGGVALAT